MAASERIWTAALIVIGDEILSGRTHDKNIAQVASWLQVQGIRLAEVRVVPDVEDCIVEAVNALRAQNDYLFTTGVVALEHRASLRMDDHLHAECLGDRVHRDVVVRRSDAAGGEHVGELRAALVQMPHDRVRHVAHDALSLIHI